MSAVLTVARLQVTNERIWVDLLWAEDGLFALCGARDGIWDCLWAPYAGYLPFWAKLASAIVGQFPLTMWPALTLGFAALTTGLISALVAWLISSQCRSWWVVAVAAFTPVLLPIFGEEAVGSLANSIYLLTYGAAIAIAFPLHSRTYAGIAVGLVLLTTLSTPIGLILLAAVVWQWCQGRFASQTVGAIITAAAFAGSAVQFSTLLAGREDRPVRSAGDIVTSWLSGIWVQSIKTLPIPASQTRDRILAIDVNLATLLAIGVALVLTAVGMWLTTQPRRSVSGGTGLLFLIGVGASVVPHFANQSLARYFIVPISLWILGGALLADDYVKDTRLRRLVGVAALLITVSWLFAFAAPAGRSDGNPSWPVVLDLAEQVCRSEPDAMVGFVFTPWWPGTPDGSPEALARAAPCAILK